MKIKKKKLKSSVIFSKKTAKRLTNTSYYEAQAKNMKDIEFIESEKFRLSTPRVERISKLLIFYKSLATEELSSTGLILKGIYDKNCEAAKTFQIISNSNLISIIAKEETLMLAYRMIKGNKGALTKAAEVSAETLNSYNEEQMEFYLKSFDFPDGISLYWFHVISQLIRKGRYPWGSSKRIYVDKPGQPDKLRPITIPNFADKIVQKAICMVLEAIYEPIFEKMNISFGFRPNKGCLDAITALINQKYTNGMRTAIEGDIKSAYDTVDKQILLKILAKRIKDKKFLDLIDKRLQYDFVEKETGKRIKPSLGVPQGGIDSPYLFNIYMLELDFFIIKNLKEEIDKLNDKTLKEANKNVFIIRNAKRRNFTAQRKIKDKLKKLSSADKSSIEVIIAKKKLFNLIREMRLHTTHKLKISSANNNGRILRFYYVRYADDWILLTNGVKEVAEHLIKKIDKFLNEELKLSLSPDKTLVTDITKEPARFLGFELKISGRGAVHRIPIKNPESIKKFNLCKKSGLLIWAAPDKVRLINRLHMKGFCSESGFPKSLTWLSCLEAHAIIDRFNASLRGLANYYLPVIRNRGAMSRWIYILRYSCLKTLAQKYKLSIKKVFKRFGHNLHSKSDQTVRIRVVQNIREKTYYKDWTLLTYSDLVKDKQHLKRKKEYLRIFLKKELDKVIGEYQLKTGNIPAITSEDFLEKITWVSWRTSAALNMPCAYCGADESHQHHIKHIRKRSYKLIPDDQSYLRIMALRNRKQIPLCQTCHQKLVHGGKYNGPKLITLTPIRKMIDNRIIHVESFVKPGIEYFGKSLEEKGWTILEENVFNEIENNRK